LARPGPVGFGADVSCNCLSEFSACRPPLSIYVVFCNKSRRSVPVGGYMLPLLLPLHGDFYQTPQP
jgi:hypothetical protein